MGELLKYLHLVNVLSGDQDSRIWIPSSDDVFSSKSFFTVQSGDHALPIHFPIQKVCLEFCCTSSG